MHSIHVSAYHAPLPSSDDDEAYDENPHSDDAYDDDANDANNDDNHHDDEMMCGHHKGARGWLDEGKPLISAHPHPLLQTKQSS